MISHLTSIVKSIERLVQLSAGDVVLDIGCNDATLLSQYDSSSGIHKIGIDPSGTQFKEYYPDNVLLVPKFFDKAAFEEATGSKDVRAKVVTSISMFYDLPDPLKFVLDVASILDDQGIWMMEQSYMPLMVANKSFDTICHEHLEYYCLKQIEWMCKSAGLRVFDVSLNSCNGGSFRVYICKDSAQYMHTDAKVINDIVDEEKRMKWDTPKPYTDFVHSYDIQRRILMSFLQQQHDD
jgi:SAM-dependent methyltransferase